MKGFALRLVLKQRRKRTRKWPIHECLENIYIARTKKSYSNPDFRISCFVILQKRGGIHEFLEYINVPRTKKLYLDPDFHIFFYHIENRGKIHEFLVYIYIPRTKKSYPDPKFRKCHYP